MNSMHEVNAGFSFVKVKLLDNYWSVERYQWKVGVPMSKMLMLLLTMFVMMGSLTACDSGSMSPTAYGGDAPGDINSQHH